MSKEWKINSEWEKPPGDTTVSWFIREDPNKYRAIQISPTPNKCMKFDELIDDVMSGFNFEKVHSYMVLTDWKWNGKVPSLEIIRDFVRNMLKVLEDENCNWIESGGFIARKEMDELNQIVLTLIFSIESSTG